MSLAGNDFLAFSLLVFVAVVLLFEAAVSAWRSWRGPQAMKLHRRVQELGGALRSQAAQAVRTRPLAELPLLERHLRSVSRAQQFERLLRQAGMSWEVSRLLLGSALLGLATALALMAYVRFGWLPAVSAGAAAGTLPLLYVLWRRKRRLARLGAQLPEALDLLARALRAGHAFSAGLKMAAEELPEPTRGEFRIVHEEVTYGVSLGQALTNLAERVPGTDVRYFVVAVLVQRESGGNLTEVLDKLSQLIRERAKLLARVRVLSAEGRMSAWILGLLPFALAGLLYLANPKFMGPMFTDPIGIAILKYLLFTMLLGVLVLRQIVRIRV